MIYRIETACRSCAGTDLAPVLALGNTPLADRLVTADMLATSDPTVHLDLVCCASCGLVQITATVQPDILFGQTFQNFSSVSYALLAHSMENALELIDRCELSDESLVIEIASNDGYLLRNFVERSIPVLGIDPAKDPAAAAERIGVPTIKDYFGRDLASKLKRDGKTADLVVANNVLAHVADLNGLVEGIATVLKPDGLAVLEMPYVADLIDHGEFDTIYHQHLCYFSMTALVALFKRHGLVVQDVRRLWIHGGSLRIFVGHGAEPSADVEALLEHERARRLDGPQGYHAIAAQVRSLKSELVALLQDYRSSGQKIVAYGAAAKATTLLAYCGIGRETLDYVVDRNPHKHGRSMPGCRLPIEPVERLLEDQPNAVLLLSWNFADEIIAQQQEYLARGGTFIVPIPELRLVEGDIHRNTAAIKTDQPLVIVDHS
ncbi:MAG: class I SAM-dependent methyltransferase [Geminicoccaceae bacterium]